jgi:hypothetical protein
MSLDKIVKCLEADPGFVVWVWVILCALDCSFTLEERKKLYVSSERERERELFFVTLRNKNVIGKILLSSSTNLKGKIGDYFDDQRYQNQNQTFCVFRF